MTAVRLLREAEEELRAAAEFYEAEQPGLGRALIQEVRRGLDSSASNRWQRESSVARFGFGPLLGFRTESTTERVRKKS